MKKTFFSCWLFFVWQAAQSAQINPPQTKMWKNTPNHKPLVIMGIRRCGKTFIAQQALAGN